MEKRILMVAAFVMFAFSGQFAFAKKSTPLSTPVESQKRTIQYEWYADEGLTDAVGVYNTISYEINRLRAVFPGYVFSETHYMGLSHFEWGYNPNFLTVVIYSNL